MSALHLSQQNTSKAQAVKSIERRKSQKDDDLLDLFPLPRYFQVHFQHIHERTGNVHEELAELKMYVTNLEAKLDVVLMLLAQQQR